MALSNHDTLMETENQPDHEPPTISVAEFVELAPAELEIKVIAGAAGLSSRLISSERIQKLGLALSGFRSYLHPGRIQIMGHSETSYLEQFNDTERASAYSNVDANVVCCILLTRGITPHSHLIGIAEKHNLPLLQTPLVSSKAISVTTNFLQEVLAPETTMHGVLMEIHGIGVTITGESGIGKSECALDLITRGHRLVADDSIRIRQVGRRVVGTSPGMTFEHLEIRGLGIINVRETFGVAAVCRSVVIELCIELKRWEEVENIERIGIETEECTILNTPSTKFVLPVRPGRNLATLVETAVRIYLLKRDGYDAARLLVEKHDRALGQKRGG